jgi:hypothetical protein
VSTCLVSGATHTNTHTHAHHRRCLLSCHSVHASCRVRLVAAAYVYMHVNMDGCCVEGERGHGRGVGVVLAHCNMVLWW